MPVTTRLAQTALSRALTGLLVVALGLFVATLAQFGSSRSVSVAESASFGASLLPKMTAAAGQRLSSYQPSGERIGHGPPAAASSPCAAQEASLSVGSRHYPGDVVSRLWRRFELREARAPPAI